ncbi:hypothetical protein UFOVP272_7 [uncultured Caudovirales phage]|uniref:Scaffold protein n=1 Tax=uncultured Caudovirales phage TaxID=2100421 RepID=A0A6J5LKX2_9CAUD|nr:hypothetical protein UFOVP272_7 [uncultured Caudovirales phage]
MSEVQEVQVAQPKVAANVVTSENLAEFNAKRMGLADSTPSEAAPVAEPPKVENEQSEPVEASEEATTTEDRKRNPKLEIRFEKITKQREEAREEARKEREARESLEAKVKELESRSQPQKAQSTEEPRPEQFTDMYEYAKALTDYKVDQRLSEEKQKLEQAKIEAKRQEVIDTWTKRVQSAKSEIPDFEEMVGSADVTVSNEIRDAIFESDVGPQLLYHLAENPEIAEKLQGMTITTALRTIGKLEAQFEKTEPQTKTVVGRSKAPAPINPIRSAANGRDVPLTSDGKFEGSYQAYKAARMAGRIR